MRCLASGGSALPGGRWAGAPPAEPAGRPAGRCRVSHTASSPPHSQGGQRSRRPAGQLRLGENAGGLQEGRRRRLHHSPRWNTAPAGAHTLLAFRHCASIVRGSPRLSRALPPNATTATRPSRPAAPSALRPCEACRGRKRAPLVTHGAAPTCGYICTNGVSCSSACLRAA